MTSVEEFCSAPSDELLNLCSKKQLWEIVDRYELSGVDKRMRKDEVREMIRVKLSELQVLPVTSRRATAGVNPAAEKMSFVGLSFEQKKELIRMQQLHEKEMRVSEMEIEKLRLDDLMRKREMEFEKIKHEQKLAVERQNQEFQLKFESLKLQNASGSPVHRTDGSFNLINNLKLLPVFNERDPDVFFSLFESIADERDWPETDRTVMLQSVLVGKAQEAYTALSVDERKKYDSVKSAVLKAFELVPEAYRQRFRAWRKGERQTHVEVTRELCNHFDRWCSTSNVKSFSELREMMIIEQLKNIVPDQIAVYINENKPRTAAEAASLADDFVLTHKNRFSSGNRGNGNVHFKQSQQIDPYLHSRRAISDSTCRYCLEVGHWKNECPLLKNKQIRGKNKNTAPVLLTNCFPQTPAVCSTDDSVIKGNCSEIKGNTGYAPFISQGCVSLLEEHESVPVRVLRDTGSSESFILESILPFSSSSYVGKNVLIRGIALQTLSVPLHKFSLQSQLVNGEVIMGVRPSLPVEGVDIILGNNLAGESVWPVMTPAPIVTTSSVLDQECCKLSEDVSCVVTRSKSKMLNESNLNDTRVPVESVAPGLSLLSKISRTEFIVAQRDDPGLEKMFAAVLPPEEVESAATGYYINDGVLLRKWLALHEDGGGESVVQVVVPEKFRDVVLKLSHGDLAGHLGVKKTYSRVLQHFYWPLLKKDISRFIRTCHTCQVTGKPNQPLKLAPLYPIPPVEQPFEYLLIDCVGPLPPSKSGSKFLLTVMCQSTRYPAAYALRNITTRSVVKALSQFISIFGIPKVIQSDQGTNFTSKMFAEILKQLGVKHHHSSAQHPQSQGVLERFHQTLKCLLRAYCVELNRDWEEGLPWLLLASREVTQSSLGFSPNDLVFGHKIRGLLSVLGDQLKGKQPPQSLLEYVNGFKRRLILAGQAAKENLEKAQIKMKTLFDRRSEQRVFKPGDQVLALLSLVSSPFCAKFVGPYTVVRALSDLNYEIATPDRKKITQICHVNLLKPFFSRDCQADIKSSGVISPAIEALGQSSAGDREGGKFLDDAVVPPRLNNSETLKELEDLLSRLTVVQRVELSHLIREFPSLFGDVPSQTHLLEHDVGDASRKRQRFYRVPFDKCIKLESEIQHMLKNNIAKLLCSSWASPWLPCHVPLWWSDEAVVLVSH